MLGSLESVLEADPMPFSQQTPDSDLPYIRVPLDDDDVDAVALDTNPRKFSHMNMALICRRGIGCETCP